MLVVVASARDEQACAVARRWAPHEVGTLTPSDLATEGWRFAPARPHASTAVVERRTVATTAISGVLVRLPAVTRRDVPDVAAEERDYVASEMTAFLAAWLASLTCAVLNPPSPPLLTAPAWSPERWRLEASRQGIPLDKRAAAAAACVAEHGALAVTVVGGRCIGAAHGAAGDHALRLARASGVELLVARFAPACRGFDLISADPWADIDDPDVAAAILEHLLTPRLRPAALRAPR